MNLNDIENTYTNKIPINKIFLNNVVVLNNNETKEAYNKLSDHSYLKLPNLKVYIKDIIPTQKFLTIDNLKEVKNINKDTKAYLLFKDNKYYVLDGHHRIAINILNQNTFIYAYVFNMS